MRKVSYKNERCKGCGLCIESCPKKIINFSTKLNSKGYYSATVEAEKMSLCIACGSCYKICPDCVITIEV